MGILPIDRDKKGFLPAYGRARRMHLLSKEARSKISWRRMDEVNEIILVGLMFVLVPIVKYCVKMIFNKKIKINKKRFENNELIQLCKKIKND